jgi:cytidine deaminase
MAFTPSDLYRRATEVRSRAYAPYSGFEVGAALLAQDGRVFTGVNVENASYAVSLCAERVALATAVAAGARAFEALAVAGPAGSQTVPCGMCRQALAEFGEALSIVFADERGDLVRTSLADLLPVAFHLRPEVRP